MPKKTVETIVSSGNYYLIQVKANQRSLYNEMQRILVEQRPLNHYEEHEKGHGRHSSWYVSIFDICSSEKCSEWKQLRRIIHVHKRTIKKGKESHSDRVYISNHRELDAQYYHNAIRGHWKIENSLHWVKDVIHKEDANRIRTKNGPINNAIFSTIAINIHRKNGNHSITEGQIKFGRKIGNLFELIRT